MAFHADHSAHPKRQRKLSGQDPGEPLSSRQNPNASLAETHSSLVRKANQRPPRRSARLNSLPGERTEQEILRNPVCRVSSLDRSKLSLENPPTTLLCKGRKRSHEPEHTPSDVANATPAKRLRGSIAEVANREAQTGSTETLNDLIYHWQRERTWPAEYSEPDTMDRLLARKRSTPSLRRKRSAPDSLAASSDAPSDQKPREKKSAPYQDPRYKALLESKGIFMREYIGAGGKGINEGSKHMCQTLLKSKQEVPNNSLFDDDIFDRTCDMIDGRNEAKVIQDISRLLVPSAQTLALRHPTLECLTESVNEGWNNSIPLTEPRPQPDYSVGFRRGAFTEQQLSKLSPFVGDFIAGDQSLFMATYYMYFPFLTCEVKCGAAALDVADRQNAHSMTLAVRAIVELFRFVKREEEVNREILAFSISHDHRSVRIYGHYAALDGRKTTFHRHLIRTFDFTELGGKEKWTACTFTKNVFCVWMPTHFEKVCSAIDALPAGLDFDVSPLPQDSALSPDSASQPFMECRTEDDDCYSGDITPDTSLARRGTPKWSRTKVAK